MTQDSGRLLPFPPDYRASGVLLHVTSLPSPYGIGDLGPSAFKWIDTLCDAQQSWWQSLPLGPTGYGNSPYQPLSSFAGNWLLISPDGLVGVYRKMHVGAGAGYIDSYVAPGEALGLYQTRIGPVGIAICYDVWLNPEISKLLSLKGARLLIAPTASVATTQPEDLRQLSFARARN